MVQNFIKNKFRNFLSYLPDHIKMSSFGFRFVLWNYDDVVNFNSQQLLEFPHRQKKYLIVANSNQWSNFDLLQILYYRPINFKNYFTSESIFRWEYINLVLCFSFTTELSNKMFQCIFKSISALGFLGHFDWMHMNPYLRKKIL